MPKITNPRYREFLDNDNIDPVARKDFESRLAGVKYEAAHMADANLPARIVCILLWTTGARINEILRLRAKDFSKSSTHLSITMPGAKGGKARTIDLPFEDKFSQEIYNYVKDFYPEYVVFWRLQSTSVRHGVTRSFKSKGPTGEVIWKKKRYEKKYFDIGHRFSVQFREWFYDQKEGEKRIPLPLYFLRHSRFSVAAEKLTLRELMKLKGARTESSMMKYIHQTKKQRHKMAKELVK